MYLTLIHFN